jgi:surface protein
VLAIRMMDIRFVFSSLIYSLTTNKLFLSERDTQQNLLERKWIPDDCVAERGTGIPLDLVIIIKNYLYDTLTDQNFCEAIALWIENEECKFRFSHHGDWNTSGVTNMISAFWMFHGVREFNGSIGQWKVSNMSNMSFMFYSTRQFNRDLSQWDVSKVTDMRVMFQAFNGTQNA